MGLGGGGYLIRLPVPAPALAAAPRSGTWRRDSVPGFRYPPRLPVPAAGYPMGPAPYPRQCWTGLAYLPQMQSGHPAGQPPEAPPRNGFRRCEELDTAPAWPNWTRGPAATCSLQPDSLVSERLQQ